MGKAELKMRQTLQELIEVAKQVENPECIEFAPHIYKDFKWRYITLPDGSLITKFYLQKKGIPSTRS